MIPLETILMIGIAHAGIFYIIIAKQNLANKAYIYALENWAPQVPYMAKLFSCVFCMCFWLILIECGIRQVFWPYAIAVALVAATVCQAVFNIMVGDS